MNISIRTAHEYDFPKILSLIQELAIFEKSENEICNSVEQMIQEKDFFHGLVAEMKSENIIGMAIYFFSYSTWKGKCLYLDDLYVQEPYRRNGVGTQLLKEIFSIAKKENCKKVRWQVLNWNSNAMNMYEKMGASIDQELLTCDFDEHQIQNISCPKK